MSKEPWKCGDCGTVYSAKVRYCKNTELDKIAIQKYREGYLSGLSHVGDDLREFKTAIETINRLGFEVIVRTDQE
jgi:hypothetical protein